MKNPKITLTKDGLWLIDAPDCPDWKNYKDKFYHSSHPFHGPNDEYNHDMNLYDEALEKSIKKGVKFKDVKIEKTNGNYHLATFQNSFIILLIIGELYEIPNEYKVEIGPLPERGYQYCRLEPLTKQEPENIGFQGKHVHHSQQSRHESTPVIEQKEEQTIEQKVFDALYPIYGDLDILPGEMSNITFSLWINRPDIRSYLHQRVEKAREDILKILQPESKQLTPKKDEDDFYKFLLMEIIDYERLRDGFKEGTNQYEIYSLMVRELTKIKSIYATT